ncbi:hypothetical protein CgunFtcFv8_024848 [Champsocephalus gunnari]|uniref:Uncharacterized protein n=1 Tax=Champsocephalus gunnari TaxID=52237 RepID=A0AAN8DG06_CHAGU|nr:hypothetical protein CgunFtcFv8_024848 [Champsocephalus gunnari]
MDASLPHTRGVRNSEALRCVCGLKVSGTDSYQICSSCLGLEHAQEAIDNPVSCGHCARLTVKSLHRRLAQQASLSGRDPLMSTDLPTGNQDTGASAAEMEPLTAVWGSPTAAPAEPESRAISGRDPVAARNTGTGPHAIPSWGSRLDLTMVSPAEDVLELDYMEDEEYTSEFLLSDSDEQEDDIFMSTAQAAKPGAMAALPGDSTPASPCLSMDLQAVCQRAAARLDIPWPKVAKETSRSRYEGKLFSQTTRAKRQLLPVFPEMLDEVSVSWRDRPFSNKAPIQGAYSLDCDGMERLGLLHIPPMEPLVAAHLLPRMGQPPSRNPSLPAKTDRFQSTMTERAYRAAALSARALNVSSMLTAYQAELCEDMSSNPGPATLDEIAAVTDICLLVQRCAVQATGKIMGIMVVQERARWLNLTNLPDREKEDVLDMPIVPVGIFGSALASMQRKCESKKKEDEALHLCLP